jgi:hypothetical protein
MPSSDTDYEQLKGKDIITREGDKLGTISEVIHPNHSVAPGEKGHFFRFDPGDLKSWFGGLDEAYLPEATIYSVTNEGVYVNLTEEQIKQRMWDHPTDLEGYITE